MNRLVGLWWLSSIFFLSSLALAQGASNAFLWTAAGGMQDLGTLPGWQGSAGDAINDHGLVVGDSSMDDGRTTCSGWSEKTGMRRVPGFSSKECIAVGINNARQVTVNLMSSGLLHAFLWTKENGMQDRGDLGSGSSEAYAINKSGIVVGSSQNSSDIVRPFVWTQSAGMQDLINLTENCPTCQGIARAINDGGVVVGQITPKNNGAVTAFVWKNGHFRLLGMLGGRRGGRGSLATGINKSGQVVGMSTVASGALHAFLWTDSGGMQDLGLLPNATECFAYGINDSTQVVGYCLLADLTGRAFLWTASAGMQDIGTLGGASAMAYPINNVGQVTGSADTQ